MTTLSEATRRNVTNTLLVALADNYVFPDKAAEMSDYIQGKLEAGSYSTIDDVHVLAERLKVDMQHVTSDEHIRLRHDPDAFARLKAQDARPDTDDDPNVQIFIERERYDNFGFKRVERLAGNIGYIRLDAFVNVEWAGKTAAVAMNFVAECHALIFDLRNNGGGNPAMVQFISSYLFRGSRHLNTFYWRPTDSYNQLWTQTHVQGKKLTDIPVYVLTSAKTFSAAESFTYALKHMERATVVGETTRGGAHPGGEMAIEEGFVIWMPQGQDINAITNSNFEGIGVIPHIAVSEEKALKTAHLHALKQIRDNVAEDQQDRLQWEYETARVQYEPHMIAPDVLTRYTGNYGQKSFSLDNAMLLMRDTSSRPHPLTPVNDTVFMHERADNMRYEFVIPEGADRATALKYIFRDGDPIVTIPRDAEG